MGWWEVVLALLIGGLASLALYFYNILYLWPERLREKLRRQGIKGPPASLVLGNTLQIKKIYEEEKAQSHSRGGSEGGDPSTYSTPSALFPYMHRWTKEYGPLFIYSTGCVQILYVSRPDIVKEIGLCKSLDLGRPTYILKERGALFGRGILVSSGDAWFHQRKVISPELFMDKVKGMMGIMIESAISLLSSWESKIESEGGVVELKVDEYLRIFSMDVISKACFGGNYLRGKEIFSRLRQLQKLVLKPSLLNGVPGFRNLPTNTNREIWKLDQEIHSLILNVAKQRRERPSNSFVEDLLQTVINNAGTGPDNAENFIVDNCKSIYFAGHETTAISVGWCLMLLSSHPEWQARSRAEVLDVCRGQTPDYDMLSKMKVLMMVIQETLRLFPPAATVMRQALQEMKLGEVVIPKGVTMQVPIVKLHHDPENWGQNVHEFNPGRFANGVTGACKLPYLYIPFGLGARTCPGQNFAIIEMKIILSLLLSRFTFSLSPRYVHSPAYLVTIYPDRGVPLIIKKF